MAFNDAPEFASLSDDIVAVGGDLRVETLLRAYWNGIFPWPEDEDSPVLWFHPDPRGILRTDHLHISRSLQRVLKRQPFRICVNRDFTAVIDHCATAPRPQQSGTWITPAMRDAYIALHRAGWAHSVEAYEQDHLVGGLYGVFVGGVFSGESMFHLVDNASRVALVALMGMLRQMGISFLDTQMMTPVVESMGGERVSRQEYLDLLRHSHARCGQ